MNLNDIDDIFPEEGWREPGDDANRLAAYIMVLLAFLAGIGGSIYCGLFAFDPRRIEADLERTAQSSDQYLFGGMSLFLCAMAIGSAYWLIRESRHWNLRNLTADKVVAGIFLFAIAIGVIAVWLLQAGSGAAAIPVSAVLISAALGIFVLALAIGLAVAGYQALATKPRRLGRARILARYGVDDKLQRVDAHPCPAEDGLIPIVEVQFLDGEAVTLQATSWAYELSKPGAVGLLQGTRRKLHRFNPEA